MSRAFDAQHGGPEKTFANRAKSYSMFVPQHDMSFWKWRNGAAADLQPVLTSQIPTHSAAWHATTSLYRQSRGIRRAGHDHYFRRKSEMLHASEYRSAPYDPNNGNSLPKRRCLRCPSSQLIKIALQTCLEDSYPWSVRRPEAKLLEPAGGRSPAIVVSGPDCAILCQDCNDTSSAVLQNVTKCIVVINVCSCPP